MPVALHLVNNFTGLVFVGTKGDAIPSAAPYLMEMPGLTVATVAVLLQAATTFIALSLLMKRAGRQVDGAGSTRPASRYPRLRLIETAEPSHGYCRV
jgi:hypothetical protein